MTSHGWRVLIDAGAVADVRATLERWRAATPERRALPDDAFRLDLIRTVEGDRLRVLVDEERLRTLRPD